VFTGYRRARNPDWPPSPAGRRRLRGNRHKRNTVVAVSANPRQSKDGEQMTDLNVIDASPQQRVDISGFKDALVRDADAHEPRYGVLRSPDGKELPLPEPL